MKITKNYCCMICGSLIHKWTALYGGSLCRQCDSISKRQNRNYCCKECGNLICVQIALRGSGLCCKCSLKYKKTNKGIQLSQATKNKISKANKGRFIGEKSGMWRGGLPKCIDCGKQLKFYYNKRCLSCYKKWAKIPQNNPRFGKSAFHNKYISYKNIYFHSSWEANFAKWCDGSGIKWQYEPETFDLGSATYTPDFYLPEFDHYIEIKGYWRDDAKRKFKFTQKYFNINLEVFDKKILKRLGILN